MVVVKLKNLTDLLGFVNELLVYSSVAGKFHVADNGNVDKVFFSWTSNCLVFIMVDVLETLL